jgi:hypothetical protein
VSRERDSGKRQPPIQAVYGPAIRAAQRGEGSDRCRGDDQAKRRQGERAAAGKREAREDCGGTDRDLR